MSTAEHVRERIAVAADKIDWNDVPDTAIRSFNLARELQVESEDQFERCSVAWGTAAGGVISLCVVSIFSLATTKSYEFTLGLVTVHQLVRQLVLWWRKRRAAEAARILQTSTLELVHRLAQEHPL